MDEALRGVSQEGNVRSLYKLIRENGNILRCFDEVEFIETPLHIVAEEGHIPFAMEMMTLKPSFAWKLNQEGLTPIHLAAKKRDQSLMIRILQINKDLARVRGKKGKTPLHYICKKTNDDGFLEKFLEVASAECSRDVTTKNQTALHIAVEKGKVDVLRVLTRMLRKTKSTDYCQEVVNQKDEDGNTALHIAATNNQFKMVELLLECKADKYVTNGAGKTPLDLVEQSGDGFGILRRCLIQSVSIFHNKLIKPISKYMTEASSLIFHDIDNISSEDRSALLVILGLLLTTTYQACLSPPGGVWQGEASASSDSEVDYTKKLGKSVMDPIRFLYFYVPTCTVFVVAFSLTLGLLKPFPRGFRTALQVLLAFLAICFYQSTLFLAPSNDASRVIIIFSALLAALMMVMCVSHRVSKLSVAIIIWWFYPLNNISKDIVLGCSLYIFHYDEFWEGTITVLGFYLLIGLCLRTFLHPLIVVGCWLFLSLCRFCKKQCNIRCFV